MSNGSSYIGKQIGNYRIVTQLSSTFFSRVFRGEHLYLPDRVVAIKLLRAPLDSPQESDQFLMEARLLIELTHRHILSILDAGIYENSPYLVFEYAHNGSLRDRLRRYASPHPLPVEEALNILLEVGQALHYAHEKNVVHCDLKPENILFNKKDEALLADFNIATVLEAAKTQSVDNARGTAPYMAPEQFEGNVSTKSDQYALACIAYELLTGHPPFTAPNAFAYALKHRQEYPPPPTHLNPDLPTHIEQAILKAMAKERTERYISVSAFITALHLFPVQKAKEPSAAESNILRNLKRCREIVETYEHAILNPKSAIFHKERGDLLYELKRDKEALEEYEQAIQLDPYLAKAHHGKGNVLYSFNRYGEAIAAYEYAIRLNPHLAKAHNGKAWALWHLKRYDEALAAYERAIELNPYYDSPYVGKGNVLLELQRYQEAITAYERATQLDPKLIDAYLGKGDALSGLRRYQEAVTAYEKAIQLDPKLASAHDGKANSLWGLKRYEEALAAYDQTIALHPRADYYRHKGDLLRWLGRLDEARQAYEQARQLGYNE